MTYHPSARSPADPGPGPNLFADPVEVAPGSPDAPAAGCACPTVANIGYRTGIDPYPLLDPRCPLHPPHRIGADDPVDPGAAP